MKLNMFIRESLVCNDGEHCKMTVPFPLTTLKADTMAQSCTDEIVFRADITAGDAALSLQVDTFRFHEDPLRHTLISHSEA